MENFEGLNEDPVIKSFLKRFPPKEWNDVIKKTLKFGIHSMNTFENLCVIDHSPVKRISMIGLEKELANDSINNIYLNDENFKLEDTTPSSTKEATRIIRQESKPPKKKKYSSSLASKKKCFLDAPRFNNINFDCLNQSKEAKRLKSVRLKEKKNSNSKKMLIFSGDSKNQSKNKLNSGKLDFKELETCYSKTFNSMLKQRFDSKLSPKAQCEASLEKKIKKSIKKFSSNSIKDISIISQRSKKIHSLKLDPYAYVTSSSDEC